MTSIKKSKYNWNMVVFLTLIPIIGIIGTAIYVYYNGIVWQEPVIMFTCGFFLVWELQWVITTFAHKAYKTNVFVEWILMILGSTAFENTVLKWS